jgi:hypothetical protein
MPHEGKYIYGIIATDEAPNFGPIGIGGKKDEVVTIGANGLAAIVSDMSVDHTTASPDHLMSHTRVIEKAAERFTVIPMRFCTVAESTDEVLALLEAREREFKNLLRDFEGKMEIGIKIIWREMKQIYDEIVKENRAIRSLKQKGAVGGQQALIRAGELVEAALDEKKAVEGEEYLRPLKKVSKDSREGEPKTEDMVMDASFLVDRDWLKEFDARVEQIADENKDRIDVKYVGPMPPFSFVNLEMHWNGGKR